MNNKENHNVAYDKSESTHADKAIYNNEEKPRAFKICTAVSAMVLSIVTCVCFGWFFNIESMYFKHSPVIYIFTVTVIALAFFSAMACVLAKKPLMPPTGKAANWINYFTALELLYFLIMCIIEKNYAIAALTLLPILYFSGILKKIIAVHTLLGAGTSAWCAAIIIKTYFSYDIAVNSPFKLICQFGLAFSMLLTVSELKFDLDAGNSKIYMFLASLALCINLAALCAQIALCAKGMNEIAIYSIPACAMTIYSSKIFLAHSYRKKEDIGITPSDSENQMQISDTTDTITDVSINDVQKAKIQKGQSKDEIVG